MQNQNMQQIPGDGPQIAQVSAKEFASKFRSKRECYTFLAQECEVYLPPYGKSTIPSSLTVRNFQTT